MAAGMYLEHYLDSIENLPFELQRNFNLMRDLDQRTEDLKGQIDSLAKDYTSNARTLSSEQKLTILRQIQQSYSKSKEFGDDKVQLAMQTYEMVDKHIRRLDTDLARFEADLKEKQIESTDYDSTSSKGKKSMYLKWCVCAHTCLFLMSVCLASWHTSKYQIITRKNYTDAVSSKSIQMQ
ncbi:hypothetical protein J4Q44_G00393170 [Coregonus suidteri]|uniref:Inhibitor of growth protein N-terminal histone-binding domain-containing protein n=1 Tax=Coregonus suidteri TaxID=861788 RepID=A0AAN8KEQ8_9TELE